MHLHADDATARRLEGEPNGKTEAWHVLDAVPGATALVGVRPGVDRQRLRRALLAQDFDAVMRRLPVRAGQTVYVPGGTLHSFGPGTLVYEIEQTSDIQQHAMPWGMEDGSPLAEREREANIERLLDEWRPEPRPRFQPGLSVPVDDSVVRTVPCAGPYFALERWTAGSTAPPRPYARDGAGPQQRRRPGDRHLRRLDRPARPGADPAAAGRARGGTGERARRRPVRLRPRPR
ncbi:hypothetical protein GCM10010300_25530 [Streptomyces olivaceoviridis]|uniref:class I mannose-6-phosphate isomerase n=1 Tax=Streptomyces olivaceoviridis TaxID=1921 RepID=UPI0019C92447|nr:class I mannose-6-phosphate isomerase [Streptomyces olivaceoviridis]GGY80454.1 hypothetical protein GCM10010300_25530 [Streptomyces olivaceoviridis]